MATVVYAIGSASGHTLTAVTQQYPLGGAQAGSGGMAADPATPGWPFAVIGAAGLMLALAGGFRLVRR